MTPERGPLPPLLAHKPVHRKSDGALMVEPCLWSRRDVEAYAIEYAAAEVARLAGQADKAAGMLAAQEIIIDEMRKVTRSMDGIHENDERGALMLAGKHNALQLAFSRIGAAAGSLGVIATPSADGADAERYRWLRGATRMIDGSVEGMLTIHVIHDDDAPSEIRDDLDEAIDAAKSRAANGEGAE